MLSFMNPEIGFIETVDVALAGRGMQEVSFPINLDKSPNAINVSSISGQKIATRIHLQLRQLMRARVTRGLHPARNVSI